MTHHIEKVIVPMRRFVPKRSLGQNFLIDPNILKKIIAACDLKPTDIVLEIGPGKGFLTKAIAEHVHQLIAIEKDKYLFEELSQNMKNPNITFIHADILKYPFQHLPCHLKIISNLPYNIATIIIEKVLRHKEHFYSFFMTVQKEYALRMMANPHSKSYGAFSCFVQYHCDVKKIFDIRPTSFKPTPNVESCFLHLNISQEPKWKTDHEDLLFTVIRQAFRQRRKTIQNSLSEIISKPKLSNLLQTIELDPRLRAENLSLKDFIKITDMISDKKMEENR